MRTYDLKKQPGLPLYESLYRCIRGDILSGKLKPGERLPSKRTLCRNLEVGKTTVETAYAQLLDEGYICSREKVGYFVESVHRPAPVLPDTRTQPLPKQSCVVDLTANGTLHFPFTVWNRLQREVVLDLGEKLLAPMEQFGVMALRQAIAGHLADFRGMMVNPENILVGAGTDFLYNILVQLLGRDKIFAVEEPGYSKIRRIYEAGGARVVPTPIDSEGASAELPEAVSVLHVSPGHNFPTGVVMSTGRRQKLLQWVHSGERYIIEDDFDSEFRNASHPKPTLYSAEPRRVIYMNSFSKSLAPSIRIGYLVLPEELARRFRGELGFYSCTVPSFEQWTLARFLERGYFEKHINRMRKFYNERRRSLMAAVEAHPLCGRVRIEEQDAGLHFLLRLTTDLPDQAVEQRLEELGIRARTLSSYHRSPDLAAPHRLVVNYSGVSAEDFTAVLDALERILA